MQVARHSSIPWKAARGSLARTALSIRDLREAVGKLARFHKNADTASGRPSSELASKAPFVPGRGVGLLGINRRVLKMNDLPDSISLCHDE